VQDTAAEAAAAVVARHCDDIDNTFTPIVPSSKRAPTGGAVAGLAGDAISAILAAMIQNW
jgi:formiminotetrahydrofolate cyclodeaminase